MEHVTAMSKITKYMCATQLRATDKSPHCVLYSQYGFRRLLCWRFASSELRLCDYKGKYGKYYNMNICIKINEN